jgi:ankyrin repeat protein
VVCYRLAHIKTVKNPYIIPAAMISAAILAGFWMLKPPPQPPDISIHQAAKEGNIVAVKQHLAAGTNVNAKLQGGWTPLHLAVQEGHMEVVELLIANGADVNAVDVLLGWTPLDYAEGETAALLRKRGGKTAEELKAEGK